MTLKTIALTTAALLVLSACFGNAQESGDRQKDSGRTKNPHPPVANFPSEETLKHEIAVDPEAPLAWAELGWRLYHDQRYAEADWVMNEARRLSPNDPYILWLSGLIAYQMGHYTDAKTYLQRVYFENKTWPPTIEMATTYDLLGRLSLEDPVDLFSAAYYFSKACDERPKDWQLQFLLGFTE